MSSAFAIGYHLRIHNTSIASIYIVYLDIYMYIYIYDIYIERERVREI